MSTEEVWRPVVGFEGVYEVSSEGRVKRVKAGKGASFQRLLTTCPWGRYLAARLSDLPGKRTPKTHPVHKLVLEAFQGPCPPGYKARHLNDQPHDNRAANLMWGTHQENALDVGRNGIHGQQKLTKYTARVVCRLATSSKLSQRKIARWFRVSQPMVNYVRTGKQWGWATEDIRHP